MKSETQIAKKYLGGCLEIEYFSKWNFDIRCRHFLEGKFYFCDKCLAKMGEHKQSCQRFLVWILRTCPKKSRLPDDWLEETTDLENAIKLYEKEGI